MNCHILFISLKSLDFDEFNYFVIIREVFNFEQVRVYKGYKTGSLCIL